MSPWSDEERRAVKEIFGRPLRVLLAAWILGRRGEPFFLTEAQDAMRAYGEAPSGTRKEVQSFVVHGLLTEFADGRRIYFTPTANPYWTALWAVCHACHLPCGPRPGASAATKSRRVSTPGRR